MFEEADNFADIFRGGLPYYLLIALPIMIICSSNPVLASSEFTVHRMSQFDVNGIGYGCRASALSLEAKSLYTWSTNRHCVVAKLQDLSVDQFTQIRQKAGGLVVLLPNNLSDMSGEEKEHLNILEQAMLAQSSPIPVYFSQYNQELEKIVDDVTRTTSEKLDGKASSSQQPRESAIAELFSTISANAYQIIVSGATHVVNKNSKIPIVQGELGPQKYLKQLEGASDGATGSIKLPMIIVTAHLNTFGLYNEYPVNADAAVLMTIADLFSKMHNMPNAAPKYRLMFLLTESGALLNFQGVKKWLDENVQLQDDLVSITGSLIAVGRQINIDIENIDFVLSLDSIIKSLNASPGSPLYMHVSKPPKEGTTINNFFKILKTTGSQYNNITIDGVHKKINLADQQLAWEHERFSMKRLPAFTLSTLKSPKDPVRTTIFRDSEEEILRQTQTHAKIIAESLARYIYNIEQEGEIFAGALQINKNMLKSYLNLKSALHNNDLKNAFEKYLKNVKIIYDKPDHREPDFMFYEGQEANLNVYRVKPAVFDLFLTILICAYLASVYLVIQYFPSFYDLVCKMTKSQGSSGAASHYSSQSERNKAKMS